MDNYIGPYWSDGKFQSSVAYGKTRPRSRTDKAARYHDTAYALYGDRRHRAAADLLFHNSVEQEGLISHMMGDAVLYGNSFFNPYGDDYTSSDMEDVVGIPKNDPYIDPIPALGGGTEYNPNLVGDTKPTSNTDNGLLFPAVGGKIDNNGYVTPVGSFFDPNVPVLGTTPTIDIGGLTNLTNLGFTSKVDAGQKMSLQDTNNLKTPLYDR